MKLPLHNGAFLRVELGLAGGDRGNEDLHEVSERCGLGAERTTTVGVGPPREEAVCTRIGAEHTNRLGVRPSCKCQTNSENTDRGPNRHLNDGRK